MSAWTPRSIWYRYFFFGWLFRDVNVGSLLERAAAWRHNREQARWLATYARRWVVVGLLFYALGALVETSVGAQALAAVFYLPSALSVSVNAVIGSTWLLLKAFVPPA